MANTTKLVPNAAGIWQEGLSLWMEYATGVYTSWATSNHPALGHVGMRFTVGLSGGGTETHDVISLGEWDGSDAPASYPMQLPGWRTGAVGPLPDTLPDGANAVTAFGAVRAFKETLYELVTGAGLATQDNRELATVAGVTLHYWLWVHVSEWGVTTDAVSLLHGTPTVDAIGGAPTDIIGADATPAAQPGGGVSAADITRLVNAIEDVASKEIDWTANVGGSTWSLYSKVRV